MFPISLVTLAISFLAPFTLAAPTSNVGTVVNLRIEGDTGTIFEGPVFTQGHDIETVSGGTHHCDGTNFNANPTPGPTATSALDDAAKLQGFAWDGTYWTEFDDFFITSIAGVTQTQTQFWGYFVNFHLPDVGGCQQQVNLLDEVLFAFDPFGKPALKLSGEHVARVGELVTLTVTDGQNGDPIAGASVDGQTTDAAGQVSVTFTSAGVKGLKAEKEGTVRSNRLDIVVAPRTSQRLKKFRDKHMIIATLSYPGTGEESCEAGASGLGEEEEAVERDWRDGFGYVFEGH